MKAITKGGTALNVDDSGFDYEKHPQDMIQRVALIDDRVFLKEQWIVTAEKNLKAYDSRPDELEFVSEKIFDHEPSEQELIYFMVENGLGMYDYCHVKRAYKMWAHWDD